MRHNFKSWLVIIALLVTTGKVWSQTFYVMEDSTVTECEGFLTDSESGLTPGTYDHNEDFTFTICPEGVNSLTLNWFTFCTEADYDVLRIFEGTDTFGVQIGPSYSGLILPPALTVTSCITIHFVSDANVNCSGWMFSWVADLDEPVAPDMTLVPSPPTCSTATLTADFSYNIHCDSITSSSFTILSAPIYPSITATPLGCASDSTNSVQLDFSPGLDESGTYIFEFTYFYTDACDSTWELTTWDTIVINDCPLELILDASDTVLCPGDCVNIWAEVSGGDSTTYSYAWSAGLPGTAGPHNVCPVATTTYTLTVSDAGPAADASGSITITVLIPPSAGADIVTCETDPPIALTGIPAGGTWTGPGTSGTTFDPSVAGTGTHTLTYTGVNGCEDVLTANVQPVDAGPNEAACPGSSAFLVSGFSPPGGSWSGAGISPAGLFDPVLAGTFTVTYTLGSCSDTKDINVQPIIVPLEDSTCEKNDTFSLVFSPPGGTWTGPGIINATKGTFRPDAAINNSWNVLYYTVAGCIDSTRIWVTEINAGPNQVFCTKEDTVVLIPGSPAGGYWTGPGIVDSVLGIFDPMTNPGNWNAGLYYNINGCRDFKWAFPRYTYLGPDTVPFCRDAPPWSLSYTNTNRSPGGGSFSGPMVYGTTFYPDSLAPGHYTISYNFRGCEDSLTAWILPPRKLTDTVVCELADTFDLTIWPGDIAPGGIWSGTGVTDVHGVFDPAVSGVDTHMIIYDSFWGCSDTSQVIVYELDSIFFDSLADAYCFQDTAIPMPHEPDIGIFFGLGITDTTFNPAEAGAGFHEIIFTAGAGACRQTVSRVTYVGDPIEMLATVSDDSICLGEFANLDVFASGGTGDFEYIWDSGLPPSFHHLVEPDSTTTYIVRTEDGCSDPVIDTLTIFVTPAFSVDFDTSGIQCSGEPGFATASAIGPGVYEYLWNTSPPQTTATIDALAGKSYMVTVTDASSGCLVESEVVVPGYDPVTALFLSNPTDCITLVDGGFNFVDLSSGASSWVWTFGDGTIDSYFDPTNPNHEYPGLGTYMVDLTVENIGGCADSYSLEVCVVPRPLYIYNSFSPNADGTNDFFEIDGMEDYPNNKIEIFNRYGNKIYESAPYNNDWGGFHYKTAQPLPDGAYFYIFYPETGAENIMGDVVIFR